MYFVDIEGVFSNKNETPKMVKISVCTKKLSQKNSEHVIRYFSVGGTFHFSFNSVEYGDCTLSRGLVMVIEAALYVLEIYLIILGMDGEEIYCIFI